jgi:hypothetical protein
MHRDSNSLRLAKALGHPIRIKILMAMNTPARRMSPSEFSREKEMLLGTAAYHFRKLEECECIELVATRPVRGAEEHFYEPTKKALAWKREWEGMAPVLKQNLSATALGGFVEALGECIDAGTFEKRADSHLSWDRARVDEQGFAEMAELMVEMLERYLEIQARCANRMAAEDPGVIVCFVLSLFESPPTPEPPC